MNKIITGDAVPCIWVIGLSAAGKSTLSRMLVERLWAAEKPAFLIDGDQVRDLFGNKLGFDAASRRKQTQRIVKLTKWVIRQSLIPVVAINHPFEEDRVACREIFGGYFEVYLKCDVQECARRDTKKLYIPAMRGEKSNVLGVDLEYEEPQYPDLVVETDRMTPEQSLKAIWKQVVAHLDSSSKTKICAAFLEE